MRKLWSAANIKVYLGGVALTEFLKSMCDLLGERDERYWVRSSSRAGTGSSTSTSTSTAEQIRRVPIMSIAELAALPRGRRCCSPPATGPRSPGRVPWMNGPHAEAIRASLAKWESNDGHARRVVETDQAIAETRETDRAEALLHNRDLSSSLSNARVLL
ncbi:TraM recognition domain-containing protein [uncultured Jatrophihabitans sp.]|uniref:TraM recognition domain-containing protein n=1 Tax=uncultured Jatrophihabitans sp. TaxID=1610747 RepID=UPI0035CC8398